MASPRPPRPYGNSVPRVWSTRSRLPRRVKIVTTAGYKLPYTIQIGCEVGPVLMEPRWSSLLVRQRRCAFCESIKPYLEGAWQQLCLIMCKGIELETFKTPAEIAQEALSGIACGVLSGPTLRAKSPRVSRQPSCSPSEAIAKTPCDIKAPLAPATCPFLMICVHGARWNIKEHLRHRLGSLRWIEIGR